LYLSERGVRPLARGGAFAAGANDLHALWYNPAGLFDAGSQFLFDAAWVDYGVDYTRRAIVEQRDPNTNQVVGEFEQTFPTVHGTSAAVPIPTLAGSFRLHEQWVMALGLEAPYSALTSYPEEIDGVPAPSRYSLINLDGSALAIIGAWIAYAPNDMWRFGMGLQMLVGRFVATTMYSTCVPDRFFCAQEQPEFDALTQLSVGPIVAPSGNLGVQFIPHERWQIGLSFQAPVIIRAPARIRVRLPSSPLFERARVNGEEASVAFEFPWVLRWGVQYQPIDNLFVELDGSVEGWSIHDSIDINPEGVEFANLPGFPNPTGVPPQSYARNFRDSVAIRGGGEYGLEVADITLFFLAGLSYESSAVPPASLSVLTVDLNKVTTSLGFGFGYDAWRFDFVYAHMFGEEVDVDPEEAELEVLVPLEANIVNPHTVNGGTYNARGNVLGVGLRYAFDYEDPDEEEE